MGHTIAAKIPCHRRRHERPASLPERHTPPHVPSAGQPRGPREEGEPQLRAALQQGIDAGGGYARRVGEHEGLEFGAARREREDALVRDALRAARAERAQPAQAEQRLQAW